MTMSGSLGAPHPSTCWVQNRAQHGEGQRTEPAFHSGHPGHLEFALRPGRTQKEGRQAMLGCGELEVFLGLSAVEDDVLTGKAGKVGVGFAQISAAGGQA